MDTTAVLDKYTQDLSNLPLEVKHLLEELRNKDFQLAETRKRYQSKDNQIHKFIKANGTLAKNPKEQLIYVKIEEGMAAVKKIQQEKILLANTALFLVSKHLYNFETDIAKLEADELLPPIENVLDLDGSRLDDQLANGFSDSASATPTPRSAGFSASSSDNGMRRTHKRKHTLMKSEMRPMKRFKIEDLEDDDIIPTRKASSNEGPQAGTGEDADNNLYCFCQRVSFGEMIGCDNDDCKYEWFHWSCVGITSPPKDDEVWYCPDCAPKMEKRRKKKK
ncbi:uncharacterized protein PRCAT00001328001 [Priceomyces carsonii]|uniref:uncharacterized protein n=1 Tax=Priceomyces carsonii TaxID=28549 RepID=UPI002EDAAF7C|nr:unnamed protein product [Priceomyces carsonii]